MSGDFADREAYEAALSPVDPSTPEREARVSLLSQMATPFDEDAERYIDAYAAAVRARALADVAGWVEGMVRRPEYTDGVCGVCEQYSSFCHCGTVDEVLDALLAKLREAK